MIYLVLAITISIVGLLNAVLLWFMPRLTRHDLYFAITVTPGFRDEPIGRFILRRYRAELILFSALALVGSLAAITWLGVKFISAALVVQLVASFVAFYRARQRVQPYAVSPTMIREAKLHGGRRTTAGGWMAATGPFILLAAGAVYAWIHGVEMPAPNHHRIAGRLLNIGAGHGAINLYFLTIAGTLAALTLILYGTWHWMRPVHAGGPESVRDLKFRRTVSILLLAIEYYITLQALWITLAPFQSDLKPVVLLPFLLVLILVAVVALARLGQGGSRIPGAEKSLATATGPVGDRTLDAYWKLGIFYFNRNDAAVVVERRFGLGYTLNLARPASWIILFLVFLGPLVVILAQLLPKFGT